LVPDGIPELTALLFGDTLGNSDSCNPAGLRAHNIAITTLAFCHEIV
jgi:hypothetical protein